MTRTDDFFGHLEDYLDDHEGSTPLPEVVRAAVDLAGIGLVVFGLAFWVMNKLAPFPIKKEIEEDQNVALAIIMAGVIIGISLIIASAVSGG